MAETRVPTEKEMQAKLAELRKPFEKDEIEKLPRYTGRKPDGRIPADAYGNCQECGRRHALPAIHLDYVGHAGVTERLNDVDPMWNWEPMALDANGLPAFSKDGLWIKLTVLGITRLGFGDAQGKTGPNAVKEIIGDAIRNAAMRFGVGTYLWSKSDRAEHLRELSEPEPPKPAKKANPKFARLSALKAEAVSIGIKEDGIASYIQATYGKPLKDCDQNEINAIEAHIAQLIEDKRSLDA